MFMNIITMRNPVVWAEHRGQLFTSSVFCHRKWNNSQSVNKLMHKKEPWWSPIRIGGSLCHLWKERINSTWPVSMQLMRRWSRIRMSQEVNRSPHLALIVYSISLWTWTQNSEMTSLYSKKGFPFSFFSFKQLFKCWQSVSQFQIELPFTHFSLFWFEIQPRIIEFLYFLVTPIIITKVFMMLKHSF